MSEGASVTFLPWVRRGLAAGIQGSEVGETGRVSLPVAVSLDLRPEPVILELPLLGARDVIGFDQRAVVRTWPRADVFDAEPNFLALVEFDQIDLPWRYTPIAANANILRPWIVLVVLADDEFDLAPATTEPRPRPPVLTVNDAGKLPNLAQSWAWAHGQVSGTGTANAETVGSLSSSEPHRLVSRLLCPRRLKPRTTYTAFLVPAFRIGALAALQETADTAPGVLDPAWPTGGTGPIHVPVFFHWRFGTGAAGDFETLARALTPMQDIPAGLGIRPMNVSSPGLGLPPAFESDLGLEGALAPLRFARTEWVGTARELYENNLSNLIGTPARQLAGSGHRAVAPPVYGRWHAALNQRALAAPLSTGTALGDPTPWLVELNRDPRMRVAAGLGTLVVQTKQIELMAGAWEQLGAIRRANELLRFGQIAREGSLRLFHHHFTSADDGPLLQLTAPVHAHLLSSEREGAPTVQTTTRNSVVESVLQATWRRIARPRGPIGRRQGRAFADEATQARLDNLLARLNSGSITPTTRPPNPPELPTLLRIAKTFVTDDARREQLAELIGLAPEFGMAGMALLAATFGESYTTPPFWQRPGLWLDLITAVQRPGAKQIREFSEVIDKIPPQPDFQAVEFDPKNFRSPLPDNFKEGGKDSESAAAFRAALREVFTLSKVPRAAPADKTVDIATLRSAVIRGLDPNVTIVARFRRTIHVDSRLSWTPRDLLEPILAAPQFEQPMYVPLRKLSQEWLLPGLEHVPQNKVLLLQTNQRFVEAYMAGLSHEFSRELVWNEYPTDQRETYFRQFWDPTGHVPVEGTATDRQSLFDIREIHLWGSSELGANSPRRPTVGGATHDERLVLLIRGELLHRYPNATMYLTLCADSRPAEGDPEWHPIFRGTLEPDVTFLGFDRTIAQISAPSMIETPTPPRIGHWYIVLQEHLGDPRFGFDEAASTAGPLGDGSPTWAGLGTNAGDNIDIASSSASRIGNTAAAIAKNTLQRPVRVLIPLTSLLPHAA